mmetsp:Transcript_21660/g.40833  ORF Transcript_21660/g.40833 Transcript_21660/m.40833 type:complete len:359 (+) Transcript_21660:119-1195(+)
MTPRQKTSWASIAILAAILSSDSHAFSPSSLQSRPMKSRTLSNSAISPSSTSTTRNNRNRHHTTTTSLQALPNPKSLMTKATTACFAPPITNFAIQSITALSALTATITGGVFAGSLHAIAGPDHLAALIPRCCGLPWYRAARVGAVWGMGHGVSATILGMAGFLFKKGVRLTGVLSGGGAGGGNFDLLHHAGSFMELAIGASLIIIGLLGIKEAREWEAPEENACEVTPSPGTPGTPQSLSAAATPAPYSGASMAINPNPAKRAVLFNGILHGFSWDGAPSLAPAVAISTWRGSLTFLISYALGTMAAMTLATTVIGEGTRRAAGKLDRPDLPRDLSVGSSFLALVVGVVWCGLALR